MTTILTNKGMFERDTNGIRTTNLRKSFGEVGTVRVVYQNTEYVFGPGESKSFSDDGIASALATADARLSYADSRDGMFKGNATLSTYKF
jgi:hypothetical protein